MKTLLSVALLTDLMESVSLCLLSFLHQHYNYILWEWPSSLETAFTGGKYWATCFIERRDYNKAYQKSPDAGRGVRGELDREYHHFLKLD